MKKPPLRVTRLIFVQRDRIIFTSNINQKKVNRIYDNFDPSKFVPPVGYLENGNVTLTDGNHRTKALMKKGNDFIPMALLTREEYDYVKNSDREANLKVFVGEAIYYPSFYLEIEMGIYTRYTKSFPLYDTPGEEESQKIFDIALEALRKDPEFEKLYGEHGLKNYYIRPVDIEQECNLKTKRK